RSVGFEILWPVFNNLRFYFKREMGGTHLSYGRDLIVGGARKMLP
ncbi:hypothetical protein CCACVL1_26493, partial [Corchorus capsularis]